MPRANSSKRIKKLPLTLLLAIFITVFVGCSNFFAGSLIHANRQPIIKTPKDYGLEYREIDIKTEDSLNLKGWIIPGAGKSIAVMVHPMNFTKYGYSVENQGRFKITDIEVEFIKTARELNRAGHTVLTFDLRNHGESDNSRDSIFGLGTLEYRDVTAAMRYIKSDEILKEKSLLFVSFCTGANATMLAMKNSPELFKDVKCMAAIQPISMEVFVTNFIDDKYPIFSRKVYDIEKSMVKKGGLSYDEMNPLNYCDAVTVPTLFVQAKQDSWTDTLFVKELYEKTTAPKEMFWLEGDKHRFDTYNYFGDTPEKLLEFIDKHVAQDI